MTNPHAFTSASSAQADLLCAGRFLAQRDIPEAPSKDSDFGTAIHKVLAKLTHPASIEVLHAIPGFDTLTPSQQEIAESCLKIELQNVRDFFGNDWPKSKVFREIRYPVRITPTIMHSGQVDVIYRLGPRGLVIDYKSLAAEKPENAENLQLRDLVCLTAGSLILNQVGCVIIQPLASHNPTPCLYEREDIQRSTQEMFERVIKSNDPNSPRTPGKVQCEFCRAKTNCQEYNEWAGSMLPKTRSLVDVAVQDWTPEQRVQFCDNFNIAQQWLDDIWEFMEKGVAKDPNFVPGYALKPNSPMRPVNNPQELYNRLCGLAASHDKDPEAILPMFMGCISVTKEKIAETISKITGLKGKSLDKQADELFAGLTGEIPKKSSLKKVK